MEWKPVCPFPVITDMLKRANEVTITSLDREGKPFILKGEGYLARCIQHEIDHLNGVLFVDHVKDRWLYHEKTKQKIALLDVIRLTNQGS